MSGRATGSTTPSLSRKTVRHQGTSHEFLTDATSSNACPACRPRVEHLYKSGACASPTLCLPEPLRDGSTMRRQPVQRDDDRIGKIALKTRRTLGAPMRPHVMPGLGHRSNALQRLALVPVHVEYPGHQKDVGGFGVMNGPHNRSSCLVISSIGRRASDSVTMARSTAKAIPN